MVTIPTIDQISGTTVMNKMRSLINNYIEFGGEIANTVNYMEEVIRNLPQDVTDVYNKETIDTMFSNYYTKIQVDGLISIVDNKFTNYYTKAEVNNLVETVGSFRVVIVDELPDMGQEGIIYLIQRTTSTENDYDEYIWVSQWELIGQISNLDLDNYYTKTESDARYYTKTESDGKYTQGVGNIGSDTKPIKIVNGIAVEVTNNLQKQLANVEIENQFGVIVYRYGNIIQVSFINYNHGDTTDHVVFSGIPRAYCFANGVLMSGGAVSGEIYINPWDGNLHCHQYNTNGQYGSFTYITVD